MGRKRTGRGRARGERAEAKKESFGRRLVKEAPVIGGALLLTFIFSNAGLLRKFETTALDVTMRLRHRRSHTDVAVVRITDAVYEGHFGGRSPLDPAKLQAVIEAIARGGPRLIAVALDTSAPAFREMPPPPAPPLGPPVVWARNGVYSNVRQRFRLSGVLGGREPTPPAGAILFMKDDDGVIRRYTRLCRTYEGADEKLVPTFPWEVVKQLSDGRAKGLEESDEELIVDFVGSDRVNMPADEIMRQSHDEGYRTAGVLKNKIVILGGDYAAQDEHDTPAGWALGVEVLAQMVETELKGGGTRPANAVVILILELLDGFIVLVLFRILGLGRALLVCAVTLPLLALLCSLIAFWSLAHWAYFVPILLLVFLHQVYERGKDYFRKLPDKVAGDLSGEGKEGPRVAD
jgi:hypothetical protein